LQGAAGFVDVVRGDAVDIDTLSREDTTHVSKSRERVANGMRHIE
jgi:hypothetical protein